jgi:hypothetical protein
MLRNRACRGAAGDFSSAPEAADNANRFPPRGTHEAALARERWPAWGYEPVGSTPEQFAGKFAADLARYAKVIREAGIPLQE